MTDRPRCLIDAIEHYGARSDPDGDLTRDEAAHLLQQFSDGGLTYVGAERAVASWRTQRADYQRVFDDARSRRDRMAGEL